MSAARWAAVPIPPEFRPPWLGEREVRLPELDGEVPRFEIRDGALECAFDAERMVELLRTELYSGAMSSATSLLPFSYARLPAWLRLLAARVLFLPKRWRRRDADPPWPIAPALDLVSQLAGVVPSDPWGESRWCLALTHDVDTVAGLRCCLRIADAVEERGFRSCFYIVAEAAAREPGIVRELCDRGHEIGSHDLCHDNRIAFLPAPELEERVRRARAAIEAYSGTGFRSPSLLRSPALLEAVGRHFQYDSSLSDTDLEYLRGCTTVFPYSMRGCVEIPATLPMDSSLHYIGYSPARMVELWQTKCRYIRGLGGLALSVTHAEPHLCGGERLFDGLKHFLDWVAAQPECRVQLPGEIAQLSAFRAEAAATAIPVGPPANAHDA